MRGATQSIRQVLRDYRDQEDGALLVFVAMALTVFLGLVALSFDLGRMAITDSELQSYADSVALAAAGELDGKDDSIARAILAAALISDTQTFGNANNSLQGASDYTLTFLSALPASDSAATTAVTTDPRITRFVLVNVAPTEVDLTFGAAFASLGGFSEIDTEVGATAVAGYTQYACDVTPLMFCLPSPNYTADANIGDMIYLRAGGQGAAWGAGNFGFLDPSTSRVDPESPCYGLTGVRQDACLIGAVGSITQCFPLTNGVDTQPGQRVGIEDAIFNVRFDMYSSIMNGEKNNPIYPPAPNVIKGLVPNGGGSCVRNNPSVSPNSVGLPRDDCFGSATCGGSGRFGTGTWTAGRTNYVNVNYGGVDPHPAATTRYAYYLAEIAAAGGAASRTAILTGRAETGRPQCSNRQSPDPERRVVIAAGVDCAATPIAGRTTGVPVEEFFRLFLTEPVSNDGGSPSSVEIHAEVIGSAGGGGAGSGGVDGIFRDVVQLYR